jgi:GDP-D-mannose dehydratase
MEFYSQLESDNYQSDHSKAEKTLGRKQKPRFCDLVRIMVKHNTEMFS